MPPARGDSKPCMRAGCSGTMHFARKPLPDGSLLAKAGGEPGWVCSVEAGHFQLPDGPLAPARANG